MPSFSRKDVFYVPGAGRKGKMLKVAIEYLPEPVRHEGEHTSYIASFTYGLLVGRVYRTDAGWFGEGWTPGTANMTVGPLRRRKDVARIFVEREHA